MDVEVAWVELEIRLETEPALEVTDNEAAREHSLLSSRDRLPDEVRRL